MRTTNRSAGVLVAALFVLVVTFLASFASPASAAETVWRQSFPLSPYGEITVENIRGSVRLIGWDRAEVAVEIRKFAPGQDMDLDSVGVDIVSGSEELTLRTVLEQKDGAGIRVEFLLWVPRQAVVKYVGTLEGNVGLSGLSGTVSAQVLNGNVMARDLSGSAYLRANTGDVVASFSALPDKDGAVSLESITGNVTLELPRDANADLSLDTVAGEFVTPYPVLASDDPAEFGIRVRAGRGGVNIALVTVRGNIRVQERSVSF